MSYPKRRAVLSSLFLFSVAPSLFAAGTLNVSPTTATFGNVPPNLSGKTTVTLKNLTAISFSVTAINITGSGAAAFATSGVTLPTTMTTNKTVTLTITFTPLLDNTPYSATISIVSGASNTPANITVSGTGHNHRCILNWTNPPNDAPDTIAGTNIYRAVQTGGVCGAYTKINSDLIANPATTYTDDPISGGVTYCYVATAVDSANNESAYSSPPAIATVPSP